ncbi:GNAT family N-acetyltransferase [Streptomyces sp. NPDC001118]|uniref:GNAT family N-acetyltransferase n=1 Tax=Streptomyces sp. NPDC001127 TaxID=3154377 RepID=UPI00332F9FC8
MKTTYVHHNGAASASLLNDPVGSGPAIVTEIAVWAECRGRGWGSEVLKKVCRDADAEKVTLLLSVEPGPDGLSAEALVSWYERHGFSRAINDETVMIRLPEDG